MKSITAARQPLQPTRTPVATTLIIIIVENRLETSLSRLLLIKIDWYPSAVDALLVVSVSWADWLGVGRGIRSIDRSKGSAVREIFYIFPNEYVFMIRQFTTTANLLNIWLNYFYFLPKNSFLSHKNRVFGILIREFYKYQLHHPPTVTWKMENTSRFIFANVWKITFPHFPNYW